MGHRYLTGTVGLETPIEGGHHEVAKRYTRGRKTAAAVEASWPETSDSAWPAGDRFQTIEGCYPAARVDSFGGEQMGTRGHRHDHRLMEDKTSTERVECGGLHSWDGAGREDP